MCCHIVKLTSLFDNSCTPFGEFVGKIDLYSLKNVIKPAYKNYKNINHDLTLAKCMILDFIMKTHTTNKLYSTNVSDYKLNLCHVYGLKFNVKEDDSITYYICVKSGKMFVI
jgi:hypothetical protein